MAQLRFANLTGEHTELPEVVEAGAGTSNLFRLLQHKFGTRSQLQ